MFFKTKENNKIKKRNIRHIVLMGVALLILIIIIFMTNMQVVLQNVRQIFNEYDTNKTGELINNT